MKIIKSKNKTNRSLKGQEKMISAIYDRRSIRKFIDKPISEKDMIDIIQC